MFLYIIRASIFGILLSAIIGCVSIDLSKNETTRADDVKYRPPSSQFKEISSDSIDKGWRNGRNGNTITYLSECQDNYDPSLESIESGVVSGLQDVKQQSLKEGMFNGRASRKSQYLGKVDGIPTQISLMTFKKNGCIFVISYIGISNNYFDNIADYETFLKGFRAP